MVAVGSDGLWRRFTAATGLDELTDDPRYATNPDRVRNRDTLIMAVTATVAGAIVMIARVGQMAMFFGGFGGRSDDRGGLGDAAVGLLMIILAPIAATIIQLAISRAREFEADATGARISGQPLALASALEKLEAVSHARPMAVPQTVAHLFIVNPLGGRGFEELFRTHPSTEERVARLRAMANRLAA